MKKVFSVLIILILLALLLAGQASGSYWFRVIDVSPIKLAPQSEANFTVAVKGLGSQGGYVQLVFRNVSEGLNISCQKITKYVFPAGVTRYNCTIGAGDVAPGNRSFEIEVAAKGAPLEKRTAYVDVEAGNAGLAIAAPSAAAPTEEAKGSKSNETASAPQATPAAGVAAALLALLLAARRR